MATITHFVMHLSFVAPDTAAILLNDDTLKTGMESLSNFVARRSFQWIIFMCVCVKVHKKIIWIIIYPI